MLTKYRLVLLSSVSLNIFLVSLLLIWIARRGGISYLVQKFTDLTRSASIESSTTDSSPPRLSYYDMKMEQFSLLPSRDNSVVFLGDSITEQGEWNELLGQANLKNRGISGDTTTGVMKRIDKIAATQPQKLFLMIGINDIWLKKRKTQEILDNYLYILNYLEENSPKTQVYIQSILPVNNTDFSRFKGDNQQVREINQQLALMAKEFNYNYIDLYPHFINNQDELDIQYTLDGIHLTSKGYLVWAEKIKGYLK